MKGFLIAILLILPAVAFAQLEGNPENLCRNGFFPRDSKEYSIASIKAKKGERVYFYDDDDKCPNGKNCRRKSYLVNTNEVLVSRTYRDFVCAWYQPKKGSEVVGWLPRKKLDFPAFVSAKYLPWLGEWRYYDSSLNITQGERENVFNVEGTAFWKGSGDNIHIGEVKAKSELSDDRILKLTDGDCEVKLRLVVYYLVVSDNLQCGGVNVTFSGVYRKK